MSAINSITGSNAATATNNQAMSKVLGKDDFLKMLIAQLKNQDPLNPQEGSEFAAQMAQFSSLEQLTNLNTTLEAQSQNSLNLFNAQAINLVGKEITAQTAAATDGTAATTITGTVTAVNFKDQKASLTVNGQEIPFTDLLSVKGQGG
jgi:flagellar basal-body rod modification protein FlgD